MHPPDLGPIEATLLELSKASIVAFAAEHPDETFYAFGFDCHAEYGNVLLCLNTERDFANTSRSYIERWNYGPDELTALRKNFGDWLYQGFNHDQTDWVAAWQPHQDVIEGYVFSEEPTDDERDAFVETFVVMVCRVLIQLERAGALDCLRQDLGFFTQAVDHDEDESVAATRLARVRAQMAAQAVP